jgi:hypothetical protein
MSEEVSAERIAIIAAAARIPLRPESPARIARAVTPTVTRFAKEKIALELEVEPLTFNVIAAREIR